jgi:hypothetical protein
MSLDFLLENMWKTCVYMHFRIEAIVGHPTPNGSSLVCRICKIPPSCIAACGARICYIFRNYHMTCAYVHLRHHKHLVKACENHEFKERMRSLIRKQVKRTSKATNSAIVMEATKELMGELLLHPEGAPARKFDLEELVLVLYKYKYMSSPSISNNVTTSRYLQRFGLTHRSQTKCIKHKIGFQ